MNRAKGSATASCLNSGALGTSGIIVISFYIGFCKIKSLLENINAHKTTISKYKTNSQNTPRTIYLHS